MLSRREFLKQAGLIGGALLLMPACRHLPSSGYRVFSEDEAACLTALCEQVVPADEHAGASEAGVVNYIDKQASGRFPEDRAVFRDGIASLQAYSRDTHGDPFEQLGAKTQLSIMKDMERGKIPELYWDNPEDQKAFMRLVVLRTMQGFYGSPRHGGNKNYVSYRMLKLDYPLLAGQNRYRQL